MDESVARSFEAVTVALRRLRSRLRFIGTTVEAGVRTVHVVGGTPNEWTDLLASLDNADCVRADAHLRELRERPVTTTAGWRRANRRHRKMRRCKPIIQKEPWP